MQLNFSISELCRSEIAAQNNINNTPTLPVCDNLLDLIFYVLQPLRDKIGKPITVTSGYRCKALNSHPKIKGASNSQHLTGNAADIKISYIKPVDIWCYIQKSGIEYDQCILEYNSWVHISYKHGKNLKQAFRID